MDTQLEEKKRQFSWMWVGLTFNASTEEDGAGGLLKSEASFDGLVSETLSPITFPPKKILQQTNKQTTNIKQKQHTQEKEKPKGRTHMTQISRNLEH